MKGKKIIIISIIINILTIGIICNFIKKEYLNNEKIIVKAMTGTEYENNITSLNTSHEDYAKYIEESKKKIASAITDMGIETLETENATTMASNIRNLTGASSADKVSYDNTNSKLVATNVQGAIDELNDNLGKDEEDMTLHEKLDYLMNNRVNQFRFTVESIVNNGRKPSTDITNTLTLLEDGDYIIIVNAHAGSNADGANITISGLTSTNGTITLINKNDSYSNYTTIYSSASAVSVYSVMGAKAGDVLTATYNGSYSIGCNIMAIKVL